jgi:hypothetical protein
MRAGTILLAISAAVIASGAAVAQNEAMPNTIDCAAFTKRPNGNWYVGSKITFDLGEVRNITLDTEEVPPHFLSFGGTDLYNAIEQKCAKHK